MGVAIGMIALFVALDGPVFAGDAVTSATRLVTGKQIKNRSITEKDLSRATVKRLRGTTGVAGSAGARGPAGGRGTPGTPGADAQIGPDSIGDAELSSGAVTLDGLTSGGSAVDSSVEDTGAIGARSCTHFARAVSEADPGELAIPRVSPSGLTTLDDSLYFVPTVVNADGLAPVTLCNAAQTTTINTDPYTLGYTFVSP
jgi:hypothetical protein